MNRGQGVRRGLPAAPGVAAPTDRRFRRADVAPDRRRRTSRQIVRLLRWGVPALMICGALAWGGSALRHSDLLRVSRLVVRGTTRLSPGEVESLVDGIRRENLLDVDLTAYRRRILDSPWVADVTLSRVLPTTVIVQVTERVPMAVARLRAQLFLVDDTGVIIDEYGAAYQQFDLPIVDGLLVPSQADDPAASPDRVRLASAVLTALRTRSDLRRHVSQIDVSQPRDAMVMLDDDPAWLHLGDDRFVDRLQTYIDLKPTLRDRFRGIDYVDLRFDERVYVRAASRTGVLPAGLSR